MMHPTYDGRLLWPFSRRRLTDSVNFDTLLFGEVTGLPPTDFAERIMAKPRPPTPARASFLAMGISNTIRYS